LSTKNDKNKKKDKGLAFHAMLTVPKGVVKIPKNDSWGHNDVQEDRR